MNIVMTQINPSENKETKHAKPEKIMKLDQEAANPCLKEHLLSLKCIENNYYEQKRCEPYFENYKLCKGFWKNVAAERMRKGIEPALPLPQERDAVKADFLKTYQP